MEEKFTYLLVGALVGGLIGTIFKYIYDFIKNKNYSLKIKDSITEELEDLHFRLKLIFTSYEISLKNYAANKLYPEVQIPLTNPVFKNYYPDIAIDLRASQRKSLSFINSYIESINNGIEEVRGQCRHTIRNFTDENFNWWGELIKAEYHNTAMAIWHIEYHIKNQEFPFLDMDNSDIYLNYVEFKKSIDAEIDNIIAEAKN